MKYVWERNWGNCDITLDLSVSTIIQFIAFFTKSEQKMRAKKEVDAFPLSGVIVEAEVNEEGWREVGSCTTKVNYNTSDM